LQNYDKIQKMLTVNDKKLYFKKFSKNAFTPYKHTLKSAGFDLSSPEKYTIQPTQRVCVKTDIQIILPVGCYGRIAPRSGLAMKGIDVAGGYDLFLLL
jgi:dUTP pyrophosphatase